MIFEYIKLPANLFLRGEKMKKNSLLQNHLFGMWIFSFVILASIILSGLVSSCDGGIVESPSEEIDQNNLQGVPCETSFDCLPGKMCKQGSCQVVKNQKSLSKKGR